MPGSTHSRRSILAVSGAAIAAGVAGCTGTLGGDEGVPGHGVTEHGHDEVGAPVDHAEVAVNTTDDGEQHFNPHVTRVTVGGRVSWVLESGVHTATAYHPENGQPRLVPEGTAAWDSGRLSEQGETFEHTFDTEGVYHYYCRPHEQLGMIGTVVVGDPHLEDQIALQSVPADKPENVRGKLEDLNEMVRSALADDQHADGEDGAHDDGSTESGHEHDEATESDHHEG